MTLFFGKCWPDEFIDSVARTVVAIHTHPWKDIAPIAAEGAAGSEERRGGHGGVLWVVF